MSPATIGFAPHSGWAALVALGGTPARPRVLVRVRIEMADEALAGSRQPYHELEGLPIKEAERRLARFEASARALALDGLRAVLGELEGQGHAARAAGILDSSGRKGGSLAAVLAAHPLIHTHDGEHFRQALAEAAARSGLSVTRVAQKQLLDRAAAALRQPADTLRAAAQALGRPLGPPWGADQKSAALLAWMLLRAAAAAN